MSIMTMAGLEVVFIAKTGLDTGPH